MPDPITSSSSPPDLTCIFDDDPSLTCHSESPAAPAKAPNACLPPDEPLSSSALAQKFPRAFVPPPPPPGAFTVRPDQIDVHLGLPPLVAHGALGDARLTGSIDVLNANAHLGSLNEDGSRGENIGIGASRLGATLNIDYKGWSLTLGIADSVGGSLSSGDGRDIDGDGKLERCFAMSLGPFTLGECDEL